MASLLSLSKLFPSDFEAASTLDLRWCPIGGVCIASDGSKHIGFQLYYDVRTASSGVTHFVGINLIDLQWFECFDSNRKRSVAVPLKSPIQRAVDLGDLVNIPATRIE